MVPSSSHWPWLSGPNNGLIERFNRNDREAVLDMFVFQSREEVREQTEKWLNEYNEERPNEALDI